MYFTMEIMVDRTSLHLVIKLKPVGIWMFKTGLTGIFLKEYYIFKCRLNIYLLKVNNRNTRTRCEICSKLTIKTPERPQWRRSHVFIVNFDHISQLVLVFAILTLNMYMLTGSLNSNNNCPCSISWYSIRGIWIFIPICSTAN